MILYIIAIQYSMSFKRLNKGDIYGRSARSYCRRSTGLWAGVKPDSQASKILLRSRSDLHSIHMDHSRYISHQQDNVHNNRDLGSTAPHHLYDVSRHKVSALRKLFPRKRHVNALLTTLPALPASYQCRQNQIIHTDAKTGNEIPHSPFHIK